MQYRPVTLWLPRLRVPRRLSLRMLLMLLALAAVSLGWWSDHRRMSRELTGLHARHTAWSVGQLLGPPDARGSSDNSKAWASATQDGQQEWVVLVFSSAVQAEAVLVYENYNPGAVEKVAVLDQDGNETVIWEGDDPTPRTASRGVSTLPVTPEHPIRRIKVYLNSVEVPGWNEIDAVGLRDTKGQLHWAQEATASSAYGGAPTSSGRYRFVR